ncbi:Gfo/Idh/MocA family oxidoreductase [Ruminococcaceae bacterium OttesenSCG-928-L11]|nr:Gfo/Idh/MocA family oxidoreductase [Ruminococcaceae bacterium OttesenSCG-928-L11]
MSAPIKMAILGYGGQGNWHGKTLKTIPETVEVIGTYDIKENRQEAARELGYTPYNSFEDLLADKDLELVTVATPNDLHKDQVITLLNAGKNVICEKPVTMTLADLDEMIAAANKAGKLFTVHQNRRWDEDFLIVKKMLEDNTLGDAFLAESRVHGSRGIPSDWRNRKECGGGMVLDWGVHLFDQMLMMVPGRKITSVFTELTYITNENCDDGFRTILTFEDGFRALVEVGTSNFISLPRWYVMGENGTAIIENFHLDGKITMISNWETREKTDAITDWTEKDAKPIVTGAGLTKTMAPRTPDTIKEYPLPRVECDVRDYYRNIQKVIRDGAEPLVTHEQMRRVVMLMEAVFESGEKNEVIKRII